LNAPRPTLVFVVPGDLEARTGGYGYDRRIAAGLRALGWSVAVTSLEGRYPHPDAAARGAAARAFAAMPDDSLVLVDGLAFGALPDEVQREQTRLRLVALVHHPLALETGLDAGTAATLEAGERRALAAARLVIVTSEPTARALARFGVSSDRVAVVEPGTEPAPESRGTGTPLQLLSVGSVVPRKGHRVLVDALARIPDRLWRLTVAGAVDRDLAEASALRDAIHASGLDRRVTLAGDLDADALAREYDRADLFVLPTFEEGFGMAVAEAVARGLPVVSTPTGGIADLVDREAGALVPPGDVDALARVLRAAMEDEDLRRGWTEAARQARRRLPGWDVAAARMAAALGRTEAGRPADSFSAAWLTLREPVDARARSPHVTAALVRALPARRPLRVLDLGAGTGSNARFLAPRLPGPSLWTLVDQDAGLLTTARSRLPADTATRVAHLSRLDDFVDLFAATDLVTASALLDLASASWLAGLVDRVRSTGAAVLFALSYDGRFACAPVDADDERVRTLVNLHQRVDKGLGPALGPTAGDDVARRLRRAGYQVWSEPSDWILGPDDDVLQRQLIEGWAEAASALAPADAGWIREWRRRREAHLAGGRSAMVVGHLDVAGVPLAGSARD
jgi:glycosyltransferase involved in cell wall biosynthesis/SAM-dependent methyltransferase